MTRVICDADCANAPRKLLLKDMTAAWAQGEVATVVGHMSDELVWDIHGEAHIAGKEAFHAALTSMAGGPAAELHIHNIVVDGNRAAIEATLAVTDAGPHFAFCDMYVFDGEGEAATIRAISTYRRQLPEG